MGKTIQVYLPDVFSGYWEHVLDKENSMEALNAAEPYSITKPIARHFRVKNSLVFIMLG